jgi:hypothetical protein
MPTPNQIRSTIEKEIRVAFRGVTLGQGLSLREAQRADGFQKDVPEGRGIIHDSSQVPLDHLERDCTAHLDAIGFRYYIPALMLSVLDHYESASMRVIGTLSGLYPKKDSAWEYHINRYSLLNDAQKSAIAHFLSELPKLVDLDSEHQKIVPRALRNYWSKYLQTNGGLQEDGTREL